MIYRRRASPLHATRAGVAALFLAALGTLALVYSHPLVLASLLILLAAVALAARVPEAIARALRFGLPFGLAIALLNPLVSHQGLTVLARLGELGPFGRVDITLEALAAGGVLALKAIMIVFVAAIASATVDPDELLRMFRRISFHSALTAALATRMVPVLAADARRLSDAQRCRPDAGARGVRARAAIAKAVVGSALDRALDVAATLEVRGYGSARRAPRLQRPWSRHDFAFAIAALALTGLALARAAGWAPFVAYPTLRLELGNEELVLCALIALAALAPFADRRGIEP
jgi:energy-coupling factor transport system permease protein